LPGGVRIGWTIQESVQLACGTAGEHRQAWTGCGTRELIVSGLAVCYPLF
jgi:hypothetical protein